MDAIIGFFSGIGDLLVSAIEFLISFVGDIVYIAKLTGKAVTAIPGLFGLLPAPCVAVLGSIFAVVVIYKILGREG